MDSVQSRASATGWVVKKFTDCHTKR